MASKYQLPIAWNAKEALTRAFFHGMLCVPNITNMNTILRCIAICCTSKSHLNHVPKIKTTLKHSKPKPCAALPESLQCTLRPTCAHAATLVAARGKSLHEHLPLRRPEICSSSNHGESGLLLKSKLIKLLASASQHVQLSVEICRKLSCM